MFVGTGGPIPEALEEHAWVLEQPSLGTTLQHLFQNVTRLKQYVAANCTTKTLGGYTEENRQEELFF
jgi:hypothetical protein